MDDQPTFEAQPIYNRYLGEIISPVIGYMLWSTTMIDKDGDQLYLGSIRLYPLSGKGRKIVVETETNGQSVITFLQERYMYFMTCSLEGL